MYIHYYQSILYLCEYHAPYPQMRDFISKTKIKHGRQNSTCAFDHVTQAVYGRQIHLVHNNKRLLSILQGVFRGHTTPSNDNFNKNGYRPESRVHILLKKAEHSTAASGHILRYIYNILAPLGGLKKVLADKTWKIEVG